MLTGIDVLIKTLAKSQKITFLNKKNNFKYIYFF